MAQIKYLRGSEFPSGIAKGLTLVDFVASCCPPCQSREQVILAFAKSLGGRLSVARVDLDANPELIGKLGVVVLPVVMLFLDGVPQWSTMEDLTAEGLRPFHEFIVHGRPWPQKRFKSTKPLSKLRCLAAEEARPALATEPWLTGREA